MVSLADSGASGICQNPELVSSLEKTVAPASYANVWHSWQWVSLPEHALIEVGQVHTYSDLAVGLRDDNGPGTPATM